MEAHTNDFFLHYGARLLLLIFVTGMGFYFLVTYGPTTDVDPNGPDEEIPTWAAMTIVLVMMGIMGLVPLFAHLATYPLATDHQRQRPMAIFWLAFPEAVVFGILGVVFHSLYENRDSSFSGYVDTWPIIVFIELMVASVILLVALIKYRNTTAYTRAFKAVIGESMTVNTSSSATSPMSTSLLSEDHSAGNSILDGNVTLFILTAMRLFSTVFGLLLFTGFSLHYGLITEDKAESIHIVGYCVPSLWTLVIATVVLRSRIAKAYKLKLLIPEIFAGLSLVVSVSMMLNNNDSLKQDYWPAIVSGSLAGCVLLNTVWSTRYQHGGDGVAFAVTSSN